VACLWLLGFLEEMVTDPAIVGTILSNLSPKKQEDVENLLKSFNYDSLQELEYKNNDRHPVLLMLSSGLHPFPFENLPIMTEQQVTRIPHWMLIARDIFYEGADNCSSSKNNDNTLTGALIGEESIACTSPPPGSLQLESGTICGLNLASSYYVINPSGELLTTEKRLKDLFCSLTPPLEHGLCRVEPSADQYWHGATSHGVFLYCGHNGGEQFARQKRAQNCDNGLTTLQKPHSGGLAILMGCSSAGVRNNPSALSDPDGLLLTYLIRGTTAVIGTLWDVTDGEIDRFADRLLTSMNQYINDSKSRDSTELCADILKLSNEARTSCKLRHLTGSSIVYYGLPMSLQKSC
jgi:separase